jgi:hypothetical protein
VSGSRDPAEKGQLLILASGPPRAAALLEPVFAAQKVLGREASCTLGRLCCKKCPAQLVKATYLGGEG